MWRTMRHALHAEVYGVIDGLVDGDCVVLGKDLGKLGMVGMGGNLKSHLKFLG